MAWSGKSSWEIWAIGNIVCFTNLCQVANYNRYCLPFSICQFWYDCSKRKQAAKREDNEVHMQTMKSMIYIICHCWLSIPFVDISSFLLSFKVGGCLFWTSKIDKILSMHRRMEMSWLDIFKAHIFQNTNSKVTNQLWYSHRRFVVWWSVSVSLRLRRSIRLSFFAFYDLMTRFVSFSITHHLVFHDLTIRKIVCDRLLWRL
jgi:hypothetical protein